ncbi:MAG: hypothetical protein E7123_01525 [Bacteroidales bacterium]|nr:hypothetical protein [Bacteroidales bacterium]
MTKAVTKYIIAVAFCLIFFAQRSDAQFKEGAFTQNYNEATDSTSRTDTVAKMFSFKEFFGGLAHKNTIKAGTMTAGSTIFIGASQIYNKDYWKLPIVYGGIGALAGTGGYYLHKYSKTQKAYDSFMAKKTAFETANGYEYPFTAPVVDTKSKTTGTWLMVGAGLVYWGTLLDGVICYQSEKNPDPGRATLYSLLLPGLGQIYNGELFKVPIYWGCLLGSVHFLTTYNTNYVRFKRIHNEATNPDPTISSEVPISGETAKWYRDVYRRYRDYSIVATVAFYVLQVIDANVFAYMHDFQVDDDITMNIEPAVIPPNNAYAMHGYTGFNGQNALGLRLGITF